MKRPLLTLFVGTVALLTTSGCATAASSRSITATLAAERGAPVALVTTLQRGRRLALADIETLASLQVPDDTTLAYLRDSGVAYELTTAQIDQMRGAGVSPRVIDYLLTTSSRVARRSRGYYGGYAWFPSTGYFGRGFYGHSFGHGFGHSFVHGGFGRHGGRH